MAGLTLLGSITEGLVEVVCSLGEACCIDFLFCLCVEEDDSHSPVSKWEASDTTICAWSGDTLVVGRVKLMVSLLLYRR